MKNSVHWGAIFAGVFIALAGMVLFSLFSLAAGINGVNVLLPLTPSISLGAAIYSVLSAMASFAFAGFCTVRLANLRDPGRAGLHSLAAFSVAGALVPALFTRTVFFGAPGFALVPPPGMFLSAGIGWTLFLSFGLAAVTCCAGGVQACYREGLLSSTSVEEERLAA